MKKQKKKIKDIPVDWGKALKLSQKQSRDREVMQKVEEVRYHVRRLYELLFSEK